MVSASVGIAGTIGHAMARAHFQTLPGTRDILEPDAARLRGLVDAFAQLAANAGFGQIIPPMFEDSSVFDRLGEASDVVSKELYSFEDKGGRNIALRPEFTASVCRAFAQYRPTTPWKTWYAGPNFRYDKPQKGRYRQFDQVGVEAIGSDDPQLDVEVIALAQRFFDSLGLAVELRVNSLGDFADRPGYLADLEQYFQNNADRLSVQARATLAVNPLRLLDAKRPGDAAVAAEAPTILDSLGDDAAAAFDAVRLGLDGLGIDYVVDPLLVRGLDYYNRTTFEFSAPGLDAAQNAVGGGGRYDGLVEALGGPGEPGVGFAIGVDRTLLACDAAGVLPPDEQLTDVWVVDATEDRRIGLLVVEELRRAGLRADRSYDGKSMKAQMKNANRSGAAVTVIVGDEELAADSVSVRAMAAGDQQQVPHSEMLATVRSGLAQTDQK